MKGSFLSSRVSQTARLLLLLVLLLLAIPTKTFAATNRSSYFDWGPYYNQPKVLGISFSSLEELPIPFLPPEADIPPATGLLPGNPFYFFERFGENTQLIFTFNPVQKEELRLSFAQERLGEARTLTEQGKYTQAQDAISSFQDTMHTIAQNSSVLAQNKTQGVDQLVTNIEDTAAANTILVQNIALSSPPVIAQAWSHATEACEEVMDAAADAQGEPPIPQELSVSFQELKEQGLITPEETEKLYSLGTRAEIRDELDKMAASGQFPATEVAKLDQAVATNYPETFKQTNTILQFAEIRTYETYPQPSEEIQKQIKAWQDEPGDLPPPTEILPYLYHARASELAKQIDLTSFPTEQQTEVARFYPEAVVENSTFTSQLSQTQEPTPTPSPSPTSGTEETSPTPTPSPSPTPALPSAIPYLAEYDGVLPGDPTYFAKQYSERAKIFLAFHPVRRVELEMQFAQERLREASVLSQDSTKASLYEETLKKYQKSMVKISEGVREFSGSEEEKDGLAGKLESEAALHSVVFEKGLLPMPINNTVILGDMILTVQDAMDIAADVYGRPPLPAVLSNRLQDMKAQGLILPEEVDQLTQAKTREEVREKIRKLAEIGTFPPGDAKKLDEVQSEISPQDYNQLVEVRKVQELQRLRGIQAEFAQTATLRQTKAGYERQVQTLNQTTDPLAIRPEDLAGREDLLHTYEELLKNNVARPINGGQFGTDATPSAEPLDADSTTCPVGASFRPEGCFWNEINRPINDFEQYRCDKPGQYWSFAAKACVYSTIISNPEDARPPCPAGYNWSWESKTCTTGNLGGIPTPTPEPEPINDQEREKRTKSCPQNSSYKAPRGCVWDENDKPVYDPNQYRCSSGEYYSFTQKSCVPNPPPGSPYPEDSRPNCKQEEEYFAWESGKCLTTPLPYTPSPIAELADPDLPLVTPDSPFYFLKRGFETVQLTTSFTTDAKQRVRLSQARERFAESYDQLKKEDEEGFKTALAEYTKQMQQVYNDLATNPNLSEEAKKSLGDTLATQVVEQNLLLQKASVIASSELATPISAAVSVTIQGVDRAADLKGEPAIPDNIKEKIEALPSEMIADEEKQKLLGIDNRVEARLKLNSLVGQGILAQTDTAVFDTDLTSADPAALSKVSQLQKLEQITTLTDQTKQITEKVEKTEDVAKKLDEFQKTFEPGQVVPAEIRPYISLTRIDEITRTIRPDIIRLEDFGNRKDVQLATATLQQEFKPTRESLKKLEDFRRNNPGRSLPFELARTEALAFGLGIRQDAGPCYLPSPPFPANTPCPAAGAAVPITSYEWGLRPENYSVFGPTGDLFGSTGGTGKTTDEKGNALVYGKGPESTGFGNCPDGYHWMYDSGGWCMSNSGNYNSTSNSKFTTLYSPFESQQPGYTPYSPYYTAPGFPPSTSVGYTNVGDYSPNDGCQYGYDTDGRGNCIQNSYPASYTSYSNTAPYYYGTAPTNYTTNPPTGTVPGSGPTPTSPGKCPDGYHWMSDSGGWCMSNGGTYVPSGSNTPYYSPNLNQESCGPGYYWDGKGCIPSSSGGGGSTPWCWSAFPPPGGWSCGSGSSWDQSNCSCKPSGTNCESGKGWNGSSCQSCSPPSGGCNYGSSWDNGTCSCRGVIYNSGGSGTCSPPSGGCGSGWFDTSSCSCKTASSQGCYNVSASSCGSGFYWDSGACTCRSSTSTWSTGSGSSCQPPSSGCGGDGSYYDYGTCSCRSGSSTSSTPSSGSSNSSTSSSGSCPSGYHWMSDSGGWCMSDNTSGGGSTSGPTPTSAPAQTEPAPTSAPAQTEPAPTSAP